MGWSSKIEELIYTLKDDCEELDHKIRTKEERILLMKSMISESVELSDEIRIQLSKEY